MLSLALIGEEPTGEEAARFEDAVHLRAPEIGNERDRALWRLALRSPGHVRLVDAGLAFADPYSVVRHRVGLMLAILEASPHHARCFLPARWTPLTPLALAGAGLAGVFRVLAGLLVVRTHGALWR